MVVDRDTKQNAVGATDPKLSHQNGKGDILAHSEGIIATNAITTLFLPTQIGLITFLPKVRMSDLHPF